MGYCLKLKYNNLKMTLYYLIVHNYLHDNLSD